jgi:transcriptional regulator with XRE-family HTH domain
MIEANEFVRDPTSIRQLGAVLSPFAEVLRSFRINHGWRQEDLASLLGCDRGKISALENDQREEVAQDFVEGLIKATGASEAEGLALGEAMRNSQRSYVVPSDASPKAFQLAKELFDRLDVLSEEQIDILRGVIRLGASRTPGRTRERLYRKDKVWRSEGVP